MLWTPNMTRSYYEKFLRHWFWHFEWNGQIVKKKKKTQLKKSGRKWNKKSYKQIFTKVIECTNKTFCTTNIPSPGGFIRELF